MPEKMTEVDFVGKIGYEGGIISALEYGLEADDLQDQDSDLAKAWADLEKKWEKLQPALRAVEDLIPDDDW
jgi:hypothetical protein